MENSENKPWVYIAAPYSSPYPIYNVRNAMEWWDRLWKTRLVTPICPHWTMFQDFLFPQPYEEWLKYDSAILERCDALFRLDGESTGADKETILMANKKKPVFYEPQFNELLSWVKEWAKIQFAESGNKKKKD